VPELPEVETIKTQLSSYLPEEITSIQKSEVASSILKTEVPTKFFIQEVRRHGKWLIFVLKVKGQKQYMLSHLGMSGSWYISEEFPKLKHAHLILKGKSHYFSYVDPRRFGNIYVGGEELLAKKMKQNGVDVSSSDFTLDYLKKCLMKYPEREIKVCLLDQKLFAGVGNYMASEICAHARIRPQRIVKTLCEEEIRKIKRAFSTVIKGATQQGGTTFQGGYRDAFGEKGEGVKNLVVFHQKICGLCKQSEVVKIEQKTRASFYCPKCQK